MASQARDRRWWLGALTVGAVALSAAFKTQATDIWWHVRTGRWIWENGAIPRVDPFSHTATGPLKHTDWLAQLFFFGADALGGAAGLVLAKVILVGLLAALLWRLCRGAPAQRALVVCLVAMQLRFDLQTETFSFLGFAAGWWILQRVERSGRPAGLWWMPALVLLWINFHRGAPLVLALWTAALVGWSLQRATRRLLPLGCAAAGLSAVALLLNPGGSYALRSAFAVSMSETARLFLADWRPMSLDLPWPSIPVFLCLVGLWAAGWALWHRRLDFECLLVVGTTVLAVRSVRFLPYAAMAAAPGLARSLEALGAWLGPRLGGVVRAGLARASLVVLGLAALGVFYTRAYPPALWGLGAANWLLPADAAVFLRAHPPPGPMWNPLNLGGYLLYALAPEQRVFVDGRADTLYDWPFFDQVLRAPAEPALLYAQLERYRIGFAVIEPERVGQAGYARLASDRDWVTVYWDDRAAVLVRRTGGSANYLARWGFEELRPGEVLGRLLAPQPDARYEALAAEVLRNLERSPRSIRAHWMAAALWRRLDRQAEYRRERELVGALAAERDLIVPLP